MKRIRQSLRLIGLYFKLNMSSALQYRSSFWMSAFGMLLSNSTFIFFWWVAFSKIGGRIGGYDFRDVMFIWSMASSAIGLSSILFANMNQISRLIVTGEMDTFLLQPKNVLINMLCARTALTAWGDLIYGLVLMALTGQGARGWAFFALGTLTGSLLMAGVCVIGHTLTFYFGDANAAGSLVLELMVNFSIYPEGIYQGAMRLLMYTVLPAGFVVHVPLKLARGAGLQWLLLLLAFTALFLTFAQWFFNRGLKRYESGNLMITRL